MLALTQAVEVAPTDEGMVRVGDDVMTYGEAVLLAALCELSVVAPGGAMFDPATAHDYWTGPGWGEAAQKAVEGLFLAVQYQRVPEGYRFCGLTVHKSPSDVTQLHITLCVNLTWVRSDLEECGVVAPVAAEPQESPEEKQARLKAFMDKLDTPEYKAEKAAMDEAAAKVFPGESGTFSRRVDE